MPVVTAPVVALPRYQVTTDELLEHITELYGEHPRLPEVQRVIRATTVRNRWYSRPLTEQFRESGSLEERGREHLQDSLDLAENAARGALFEAGLSPGDVDALVVISASGHTMPGLDIPLLERLGLRSSVRRLPVTQLGCAGAVFGIARAMDLVTARPHDTVLVVCADVYSHYLHGGDVGMDGMIFKALIGDAAGACLVRAHADGPRMELVDSWETVHPGSRHIVGTTIGNDGLHAHNSPKLLGAIRGVMPALLEWLENTVPAGTDAVPQFVVSHTGSPRVLDTLVEGLGCAPEMVGLARDSLRELGNLGSASVLEVLERTFAKPPFDGAHGLMLTAGPGISVMALKGIWRTGD
ncbi:type III polyketide synthase [Streptomyces sp. NPDC058470]|uniref:type III polyketide synthase n=1 Tax=Streptomyces sp. NPDC058470 TaxID=3346515 RepID=UPI0036530A92